MPSYGSEPRQQAPDLGFQVERATGIEPRTTSLEAALGSVADQLPVDGDVGRDVCVGASGDLVRHDIFGYPRR